MAYGMEAVLPLFTLIPTDRIENFNPVDNNALIGAELDFTEELRDNANLRHAAYQQELARGYNKNVQARPFNVGDLVLRMVVEASKLTKLKDPYEGPYQVVQKISHGVYKHAKMRHTDRQPLEHPKTQEIPWVASAPSCSLCCAFHFTFARHVSLQASF